MVTSIFRIKISGDDEFGTARQLEKELIFRQEAPKQRSKRGDAPEVKMKELKKKLTEKEQERWQLEHDLKMARRQIGGLLHCTACESKDADYKEQGKRRSVERNQRQEAESSLEETAAQLSEQTKVVVQLTEQLAVLVKEIEKQRAKIEQQRGVVERQMAKVLESREREKKLRTSTVSLEKYEGVVAQLEAARDLVMVLERAEEELKWEYEDLEEKLVEKQSELSKASMPGRGRQAEKQASEYLKKLRPELGIKSKYSSVPAREATTEDAEQLSVRHMAAVLKGRGEGENINLVADALQRTGYLERLLEEAHRVQPNLKKVAKGVVDKSQDHWTARHAVHVWDRLELSRSQMETLRHLLSFVYNAATNSYEPINAWVRSNPHPYP